MDCTSSLNNRISKIFSFDCCANNSRWIFMSIILTRKSTRSNSFLLRNWNAQQTRLKSDATWTTKTCTIELFASNDSQMGNKQQTRILQLHNIFSCLMILLSSTMFDMGLWEGKFRSCCRCCSQPSCLSTLFRNGLLHCPFIGSVCKTASRPRQVQYQ